MSHDLHFNVQNGDGSFYPGQPGNMGVDRPLPSGALNHLPDNSNNYTYGNVNRGANNTPVSPFQAATIEFISSKLSQSSHPMVIIFHVLFKGLALFLYIFGGWFIGSGEHEGAQFISLTVVCILLLAADFWVVKNITGRLLVGLRWWNKVENDTTTWIFESAESRANQPGGKPMTINPFDSSVFWTVLYVTPALWFALFLLGVLKLQVQWLLIVVMALALSLANVYGYYKCSSEQKARFQQMMQQGAQQGAMAVVRSSMFSLLTGQTMNTPAGGGGVGGSGATYV